MGCASGREREHSPQGGGTGLLVTDGDEAQQMPTLLTGRASNAIKSGAHFVQSGVLKGTSSIRRGGAVVVASGASVLSKVHPRGALVGKEPREDYIGVDGNSHDVESATGEPEESRRRLGCGCYAKVVLGLLWAAALAGTFFLYRLGVLPRLLGSTLAAEAFLAALASPILLPCAARLLALLRPWLAALHGTNCYMWLSFAALWCALGGLVALLWYLGMMQVVVGVLFSQVVMVVLVLLLLIPCLAYFLPVLKEVALSIPARIKKKLWEIPPLILPLFESMIKNLLVDMEHRIISKLAELPKDVSMAVVNVGGNVKDLGRKSISRARDAATRAGSRRRSRSEGHLDSDPESA